MNKSSAVVFHLPDLHWEGYNFPKHRLPSSKTVMIIAARDPRVPWILKTLDFDDFVARDPRVPWILMTYESMNSVRQRAYSKGR